MADSWITQMRKGLAELSVLASLRDGEDYGYGIVRRLQRVEALALGEGTVYPLLARLTRERLVRVRRVPSEGGPPRRYYSLTREGRARLREMELYWRLLRQDVDGIVGGARSGEGEEDS